MKKLFWGIILILAAALIILSCAGINLGFIGILPITDILLSAVLLAIGVNAICEKNYWLTPYPLALIFFLFEKEIAIYCGKADTNIISNWLVLLCAVIFSVGISLIFSGFGHRKHRVFNFKLNDKGHGAPLGAETKYIDAGALDNFWYKVNMGSGELFFTNTENYKGGGTLNVECNMGNLEINVPSGWHLLTDIETSLGNTEIPGIGTPDGPQITVKGRNHMGNLEIHFC